MEYDPKEFSNQEQTSSVAGPNPLNIGFALVAAFALGLGLGFFGRPQIINDVPVQVVVTVVPNPAEAVAQAPATSSESSSQTQAPASTPANSPTQPPADSPTQPPPTEAPASANQGEGTPSLMDYVMADARHWQGEKTAPVTIVEFSDFK